jgi:hypothetical protein
MKKPIIPCIKDKCILFPVCRNKEYVTCDTLNDYFIVLYKKSNYLNTWAYINKFLPNLKSIVHSDKLQIMGSKEWIQLKRENRKDEAF